MARFVGLRGVPSQLEREPRLGKTRDRQGAHMPRFTRWLTASLVVTLPIAGCTSTQPNQPVAWGSSQISLTTAEGRVTVQIMAAGGCYGSYGEIDQPIPSGTFTLSGTYTQLMGAYPGRVEYVAQYAGMLAGRHMTLRISVPALQQVLGPFSLTAGVAKTWPACLYP
jgi:hypothetical protein